MNENELLNAIKTSPMLTNPLISVPLKMYFEEQLEKKLKENNFQLNFSFARQTKTDMFYDKINTFDYLWTDFLLFKSMTNPETAELDEFKKLTDAYIEKTIDELVLERQLRDNREKSLIDNFKTYQLLKAFFKVLPINAGLIAGLLSVCLGLNIPSIIGRITFSCLCALLFTNSTYWRFLLKKFGKFDVDEFLKK